MPGLLLPTASNVRPSYKSGFARSAAESSSPGLWKGLYSSGMGSQLYDIAARQPVSFYSNTADRIVGKYGEAWHFNDTRNAEAITLNHLGNTWLDGATEFTYGLAFRYHGTDSSNEDTLMGQWSQLQGGNDANARRAIIRYDSNNNQMDWFVFDGSDEGVITAVSIEDDGWHVVLHRFKSGEQTGWIDGVLVATDSSPGTTIVSSAHSKVPEIAGGHQATNMNRDPARVDVAAWWIWDRAITPTEIRQVSTDPLAPFRQRRFTPTYSPVAEEAAATTSVGWTRSLTPSPVRPSYKSGFARSAAESSSPGLHDGMVVAYVPALGITGDTWHNVLSTTFPASPTQTRNEGVNKFGIHSGETGSGTNTISDCRTTLQGEATVMFVGQIGTSSVGSQRIFSIDSGAGFGDWAFIRNSSYNNGLLAVNWGWAGFVVTYAVSDNATGVWVARRTGTAGSWTAEIWEDGLLAAQTTGVASNPTGGGTPACSIAGRDACKQLNALMAWNRALSDNEIRHLSKDIVAPFRQRRFTPTISGAAAAAAGWQPYWGLHATRFAGILT
jgi:hypothetical protein